MEKNEINIQFLFHFHLKTWWKACIYVKKVVHMPKYGNNNIQSIYSKKYEKYHLNRSNNGKKWNKYSIFISIPS